MWSRKRRSCVNLLDASIYGNQLRMPFLQVQCPTGPKLSIEVSPDAPLKKALETACSKRSLDPSEFIFVYQRRPVDLSTTFRFSGLVNRATVELVPVDKKNTEEQGSIRVGLRLEDGQRVEWTGLSSTSLWSILDTLAASNARVSQIVHPSDDESRVPAIVYLQDKIAGEPRLRKTTLADIGIHKGAALLQLRQSLAEDPEPQPETKSNPSERPAAKVTREQPSSSHTDIASPAVLEEPRAETTFTSQPVQNISTGQGSDTQFVSPWSIFDDRPTVSAFDRPEPTERLLSDQPPTKSAGLTQPKEPDSQSQTLGAMLGISLAPASQPAVSRSSVVVSYPFAEGSFKFPSETEGANLRNDFLNEEEMSMNQSVDRQCVVFRRPLATNVPAASEDELPDDIFEHTEDDIRSLILAYHREWNSSEPLQTAAMRNAARQRLYKKYPRSVIQFHWPDGVVMQACFHPLEKVSALYQHLRENLAQPQLAFQLYTTPPKFILKQMNSTLIEANLVPLVKVYFSADSSKTSEVLSPRILATITEENQSKAEEVVKSWMQKSSHRRHSSPPHPPAPDISATEHLVDQLSGTSGTRSDHTAERPAPKWLKLGK
ncbi:unnamed protein product [Calicophoron daubneyi]|uniref:UBX domain-containing protein n=1 Tax=Calicophoron daubneyi TaxID=300641 RepID=A0AAV2TFD9_CALDB